VGENNTWSGRVVQTTDDGVQIEVGAGQLFRIRPRKAASQGTQIDLFLRPEAMLIQPDPSIGSLNRFEVKVKAILFDGANSRLLANPLKTEREILIALPQNRQYDHIRVDDQIEVGWDVESGICFNSDR